MADTSDTDPKAAADEQLAEEWAAMSEADGEAVTEAEAGEAGGEAVRVEADTPEAGGGSGRILDQEEIDSLLGFDAGSGEDADHSGIRAIVNSALVTYERLPMLEVVFDRLVRMMTTSLRNFTSDNVEVSLDNIKGTSKNAQMSPNRGSGRHPASGFWRSVAPERLI